MPAGTAIVGLDLLDHRLQRQRAGLRRAPSMYDVTENAHVSINWNADVQTFSERTVLGTELIGCRQPNTSDPSNVLEFLKIASSVPRRYRVFSIPSTFEMQP